MKPDKKIFSLSEKELSNGAIPIDVYKDDEAVFNEIARTIADEIKAHNERGEKTLLILPVGPTGHYPGLAQIINSERIDLSGVTVINMDEYMSDEHTLIDKSDSLSFEHIMYRDFYDRVDSALLMPREQRIFPNLENGALIRETIERHGGVDLCIGGIGVDGHIAFNEPIDGMGDDEFKKLSVRVIKIRTETLITNSIIEFGGAYEFMPNYAVTIGFNEIMSSKKIRLYSLKPWHWAVVRKAAFYAPTAEFPVTLLQGMDVRIGIPKSLA